MRNFRFNVVILARTFTNLVSNPQFYKGHSQVSAQNANFTKDIRKFPFKSQFHKGQSQFHLQHVSFAKDFDVAAGNSSVKIVRAIIVQSYPKIVFIFLALNNF